MNKKGFTLVELLIVIAVLAILTAAVVVVLNPAELLRQARDSQRFSDLDILRSALSLYITDVDSPSLGTTTNCFVYGGISLAANCGGHAASATTWTGAASTSRAVNGSGWVPVAFSGISGGSPVSMLPTDPSHNATYYYTYIPGTNTTFEINAVLESSKYSTGTGNKMINTVDGGSNNLLYEIGTNLAL